MSFPDEYNHVGFDEDRNRFTLHRNPSSCYTESIEPSTGEDANMAHLKNLESVEGLEPIASRDTHPWGMVDLYAPQADPSEWGSLEWTLVAEKTDDGPLYAEVPADVAWDYFERPWMVPDKFRK